MPRINLLPWREIRKKEREIRFGILTGVALSFCGLVVMAVHLYMNDEINYQQRRNDYLTSEIKKAENKIKKIKDLEQKKIRMIDRMNTIIELEKSRPQIVYLFEELVTRVPQGVYFTSMVQKGNKIILEGIAQSDARVSSLMKNFAQSKWLTDAKPLLIKDEDNKNKKNQGRNLSTFKLEITQTTPKEF